MLEEREIDLRNIKLMGGIGMILLFLTFVPYMGGALGIAGLVLLLLSLRTFSEKVKKASIFEDYFKGFIYLLVMSIFWTLIWVFLIGVYTLFFSQVPHKTPPPLAPFFLLLMAVGCFISWIFWVIGSDYIRRSFTTIAYLTKERLFETAGLLIFWGAVLAIILFGVFLALIGDILGIVAFFSLPDKLYLEEQPSTPPS